MLKRIIRVVSLSVVLTSGVLGQTSTATLSGTVTDNNDAAIVGATVTIVNTETGIKRTVVTNDSGGFTIPLLQPSRYLLTVEAANFAPFEATDLVLNTNDNRFLNIRLKAGQIKESITVEASTVEVDMSPAVATTVDQNLVDRIPLNGRTVQNLVALTPGAVTFQPNGQTNVGQISVNGLRTTQNYMTIDGVSANLYVGTSLTGVGQANGNIPGFSQLGTTSNLVSVDALQEFKVQTSNYSAEYGRTPGAQIQMTTRSGTNKYHDTLFEYFRNEKLDANDWFANANRLARSPLRHNNFGGTFSGPLPLPNFGEGGLVFNSGKDRTFFFFSYEGLRVRLPQVADTTVVSNFVRNNAFPAIRFLFSAFPRPTGPDNPDQLTAPFVAGYSNPQSQDSTSIRIDHNITKQITLFGRYSQSPQESVSLLPSTSLATSQEGDTRTLTIGLNAAFSSNFTNEFRFNWSRNIAINQTQFRSFQGTTQPDKSLWIFPPLTSNSFVSYVFPSGIVQQNPAGRGERRQINIANTSTWVLGSHMIKFGADYRTSPARQELPDYLFSPNFFNLASILSGQAFVVYIINNPRFTEFLWKSFGSFIQDTWRVSNRLTLDVGLRWEVNPPPDLNPARRLAVLDFVNPIRFAPEGTKLFPTVWNGFAPRFGTAYQMFSKSGWETVVRGGYGLFYDLASGSAGTVTGAYFPSTASTFLANVQFPFAPSVLVPPTIVTTPPYPFGNFLTKYDDGFVLPRVHQWNLSIEQGLGNGQTLSVSYVGNAGRRLLRLAAIGPIIRAYPIPSPDFAPGTTFFMMSNREGRADSSDYNGMQVQFTRRGKNISALVNYTWSHAIDTSSNHTSQTSTHFSVDPRLDRADSLFDRRHALSAAMTWNLPSVPKTFNRILHAITAGWGLDAIFQFQTSYPLIIGYQDTTINNNLSQAFLRPDRVPGQPLWIPSSGPKGKVLNPAAFSIPTGPSRQGTLPRNSIRVDSLWQPDIALSRTFAFGERVRLKLKGEVFNFVNHPMFAEPNNILGNKNASGITLSPTFGQFTSMLNRTPSVEGIQLSSIYAPGGPRSIQLSFRLSF
ncbi:MAG: carboxypeptidase regulatory-like domain-containing protein [Acidobacteriota bacterium]|nr:carboxypeptidase regulatory-like domain-containing protein [Blastocatellia bacterium]MDW8241067.1 carboxypeptidase regulatory-like domain-containing protein [Acidobacteriota bacterium]